MANFDTVFTNQCGVSFSVNPQYMDEFREQMPAFNELSEQIHDIDTMYFLSDDRFTVYAQRMMSDTGNDAYDVSVTYEPDSWCSPIVIAEAYVDPLDERTEVAVGGEWQDEACYLRLGVKAIQEYLMQND